MFVKIWIWSSTKQTEATIPLKMEPPYVPGWASGNGKGVQMARAAQFGAVFDLGS